jgi:hypothetical protein
MLALHLGHGTRSAAVAAHCHPRFMPASPMIYFARTHPREPQRSEYPVPLQCPQVTEAPPLPVKRLPLPQHSRHFVLTGVSFVPPPHA